MDKKQFMDKVGRAQEHIHEGDIFQVVLSQRMEAAYTEDPLDAYMQLRKLGKSPYMYYLDFDEYVIAGASPELLLKGRGRSIMTMPIAGTRPRGANEQEDHKAAQSLLEDPKENAEHSMLVDLGRNDIGRVSDIGSVQVRHMKQVQRYSHVMHMTSEVHGRLKEGCDIFDALASVLPAGPLSGAPKISAMNIIEQLEPVKREIYGGAIGFLGYNKQFDACITIRTFVFHKHKVYLQAGAGIVKDSVPEKEYEETHAESKSAASCSTRRGGGMIVIIDNYDSFTYNLYQAVAVYAQDVIVLRNDAVDASMLQKLKPTALVFSPGAGHPHAAGNMESIIQQCYRDIPMLGICLGHQAIAEVFSSRITYARVIRHGECDAITQTAPCALFDGLSTTFLAARYHSLVVEQPGEELIVTAESSTKEIMAIQHHRYPVYGIQFHPESILTPDGMRIIENFITKARSYVC
ncbi:MAG: chorismate-binding protein [[Clostridium] innocuum]